MKLIITLFFLTVNAFSWETDNFSSRVELRRLPAEKIKKDLYLVNDKTNEFIEQSIDSYNRKGIPCSYDINKAGEVSDIHYLVKNTIGGFLTGTLEEWAGKTPHLNRPHIEKDIYDAWWRADDSLNIKGVILGPDKFGHFFEQGLDLYKKFVETNRNLESALLKSDRLEERFGMYGLSASGVKSYGDLAANYRGMLFYQNLLGGKKPHIKCDKNSGKYYLANPINFADYIDDSFDEGINCSLFFSFPAPASKKNLMSYNEKKWLKFGKKEIPYKNKLNRRGKRVTRNLNNIFYKSYNLKENDDLNLNNFCPVENNKCENLVSLNCSQFYISPSCFSSVITPFELSCKYEQNVRPVKNTEFTDYYYKQTPPNNKDEASSGVINE